MCLNPKWIYKKGNYKENNYLGSAGDFYELGTFSKCGSCTQCIAEKANNWLVRNFFEERRHQKKCWITLTYRNNPILLVRKDVQNFMKRLRRKLEYYGYEDKIRMFGVGEYGTLNNRPHWHIIIYGWEDEKTYLFDINKKGSLLYKSDLIESTWKHGRTTYQKWNEKELPYMSLYNTAKDTFKKAYKLTSEKLKNLEEYAYRMKAFTKEERKNLLDEIISLKNEKEEKKQKYILSKEFNFWSLALGWEEFEKEYNKTTSYVFEHYIRIGETIETFVTPSPWVKKLANMGDIMAAEEMFRREEYADQETNTEKVKIKAELKEIAKKKREIQEWDDKKTRLEEF